MCAESPRIPYSSVGFSVVALLKDNRTHKCFEIHCSTLEMVETIIVVMSKKLIELWLLFLSSSMSHNTGTDYNIVQIHVQQQLYSIQTSDNTSYD